VTGTVTNVTDFGVFVELEEGIEGLVHVSELTKEKGGNPLSRFNVDDVIQAKVINVSRTEKKIGLSIRKLEESEEREIYRSYLESRDGITSNLGELLKKGMLERENHGDEHKAEDAVKPSDEEPGSSEDDSVDEQAEKTDTV
jgi:small subunit ribosomal protein S1